MTHLLWLRLGAVLLASGLVYGRSDDAPYRQVASLPTGVDGQGFCCFAFDAAEQRLYAGSLTGLYWVDLRDREPRIKGPSLRIRISGLDIPPDSDRLFYSSLYEFGYLNLRTNDPPTQITGPLWRTAPPAFEPTRQEMYLATRDGGILVYSTATIERGPRIAIPGWYATMLEAVPGKVFVTLKGKSGLYVIDAATHTLAPWPVKGTLVTPAYFEADPTGQYLFARYDRYVVAIDIPSATVVGRLVTAGSASIAFDPERRLLIVSANELPGHPLVRLRAYSVSGKGFTEVAELKNPSNEGWGLESFRGGFLQHGYTSLLLWTATPTPRGAR